MEQQNIQSVKNQEIDLIELIGKVWKKRRFILKTCVIAAVIGLIIAFSLPKEYKTEVKLSPEVSSSKGNMGELGGLAAMAGLSLGGATGSDALYPELYPDIVSSTPFLLELANIKVETKDGELTTTFYDYMKNHQRKAWWGYIVGAPLDLISWGISLLKGEEFEEDDKINPFSLTKKQERYIKDLSKKITVNVDKKSGVITASVMMQDALVSAMVMDVVLTKLQEYVIDYRTRKAKHDLIFSEKLFEEARTAYYNVQKIYAHYVDENRNIISASYRTEEERLRNEMLLAYGVYDQMAQQLEVNKVKVQEVTPVYMVIEPARVAIKAAKPAKAILLIGFVFLGFFISCCVIVGKEIFQIPGKN